MVQNLRALKAHLEDTDWIPRTHSGSQLPVNLVLEDLIPSSVLPGHLKLIQHTDILVDKTPIKHKIQINKSKRKKC